MNFGSYSWGGDNHDKTSFVILMLLWREIDSRQILTPYFTLTQIFLGGKSKINLRVHTTFKITVFMPMSCLMRSRRHLVFWTSWRKRRRHSHSARYSLNTRNGINWKRNFKENIIKNYLGERITIEVVIFSNWKLFFCVSLKYEMSFKLHLILARKFSNYIEILYTAQK